VFGSEGLKTRRRKRRRRGRRRQTEVREALFLKEGRRCSGH